MRALVRALHGTDDAVSSPTFVFRQSYRGTPPIEHLDLYRVDDPTQLGDLALEEAFASDRIVVVEWPERAEAWLPAARLDVTIDGAGHGPRTVRLDDRRTPA